MRLTALVQSANHVCCRYRLAAFRSFLEAAGHFLELRPFPRRAWDWLRLPRALAGTDVAIVQRRLLHRWQLYLLRRACRFLVFDFDDAIFLRDSYSPKGLHSLQRERRFAATVRTADAVVAGNSFLLQHALCAGGSRCGQVIPTCVDPRWYALAEHRRTGVGCRLAWIGSASTLKGLETIRPLLERIGERIPGLSLTLVADQFLTLKHLPVLCRAWSEDEEAAALAATDIGISWVPDDDWSRGKCGLKVLQYMAAGLPVVANPVGVHATIIRHEETGFLATTEAEWLDAITRLVRDAKLRRQFGLAGRRVVEKEFNVTVGADKWIALIGQLERAARKTA